MNTDEIVSRLEAWKKHKEIVESQYQAFKALTDVSPECPLFDMVFRLWDAYTVAVSEIVGDKDALLNWYEMECDMGKNPMGVFLHGKKVKVKTLRKLAQVIKS